MTSLPEYEFDRMLGDMDVCMYRSTADGIVMQAKHGFFRLMSSDGSSKVAPLRIIREATPNADTGAFKEALRNGNRVRNMLYCIDVRDTGPGMAPEFLQRAFNLFTQETEGYSRSYEGLGLGLTLVRKYVEISGGSISVHSEPGKGSVFSMCFPLPS